MENKYINLKLNEIEIEFLIEQLALRQMEILKTVKLLKEQNNPQDKDIIYSLNIDKRTCDKLRKFMQYAKR